MTSPVGSAPLITQTEEELDWDEVTYDPDAEPVTERRPVFNVHEAPTLPAIEAAKKA